MKALYLTSLIFSLLSAYISCAQISMSEIKLGDTKTTLKNVKLKVVANENDMIKFRTKNGNDLSVTTKNGKVVYMENDWQHLQTGLQPQITHFIFGSTSLRKIRSGIGNNGFTYKTRITITTDKDLLEFNCFEFGNSAGHIIVFVTRVSLEGAKKLTEANIDDHLMLEAIIVAEKSYLDDIWGTEKIFDPDYKKIPEGFIKQI
jgi:hypothetical protein